METFLSMCDDQEADVRMVADECLNKTIKVTNSYLIIHKSCSRNIYEEINSSFRQWLRTKKFEILLRFERKTILRDNNK